MRTAIKLLIILFCFFTALNLNSFNFQNNNTEENSVSILPKNDLSKLGFVNQLQTLPDNKFRFLRGLGGGTQSAFLISDSNEKKWVLKYWKNHGAGVSESLARYLIDGLTGVNSLKANFFISNNLPDCLLECLSDGLKFDFSKGKLFSLTPFIEGKSGNFQMRSKIEPHALVLMFLSYFDIKDHNTVIDESGILHYIDTGSSLLFRGMGEKKIPNRDWNPYYLSEFASMFKTGFTDNLLAQNKIHGLADLTTLDEQLKLLLENGHRILERSDAFLRHLESKDRVEILSMLANRLYQLEILYNKRNGLWNPKARRFTQASELDGAGALVVTEHQGETFILLGQRSTSNGRGTWCNLGGTADAGEYLHETAAREVLEESGNIINSTNDIVDCPSHDLISEQNPGIFKRYRNYLIKIDHFDLKQIPDNHFTSEYSQFQWIRVEQLIKVIDGDDKSMELFTPFAQSLNQKIIRGWLESLAKKEKISRSHTAGFLNQMGTFTPHHSFYNPEEIIKESAYDFMKSDAKKITKTTKNKQGTNSISLRFLHELAKKSEIENFKSLKTRELLGLLYPGKSHIFDAILKSMEEEEKYPEHYVMYHGMRSDIWLMYRALSYIRYRLDAAPHLQTNVLRSMESNFDAYESAKKCQDKLYESGNDVSEEFFLTILSCNPTLFSNYKEDGENTLDFFAKNFNFALLTSEKVQSILTYTLQQLGIKNSKDIFTVLNSIDFKGAGALLQFFVPRKDHRHFYISEAFGKPVCDGEKKLFKTKAAMNALASLNEKAGFYSLSQGLLPLNAIQTRLHLDIANNKNLIVNSYFANETINLKEIDAKIAQALDPYLATIAKNSVTNTSVYRNQTLFQSIMRDGLQLDQSDMDEENSELELLIKNKNFIDLKKYLLIHQELLGGFSFNIKSINYGDKNIYITSKQIKVFLDLEDYYVDKVSNLKILQLIAELDQPYRGTAILLYKDNSFELFTRDIHILLTKFPKIYLESYLNVITELCKGFSSGQQVAIIKQLVKFSEQEHEALNDKLNAILTLGKGEKSPSKIENYIAEIMNLEAGEIKEFVRKILKQREEESIFLEGFYSQPTNFGQLIFDF